MGLVRLHRRLKDTDLFVVDAKHDPSCLISFRTAFANYERRIPRTEGANNSEHARMSAVHEKALVSVLKHIQTHIVQHNEVLTLSSLRLLYVEELKRNGYENSNYRAENY